MTETEIREVYEYVEARLDMEYVRETARHVAGALIVNEPVGVVLQPGDGTRYDLAFVPVADLAHAPGRVVDGKPWGSQTEFGISRDRGTALVVYHQQRRAGGFDFRSGGFEPIYLAEFFDVTTGSACTLALLFNAIAEAFSA